ncbi:hypothetical protein D3C83_250900 [compost metagenome]
MPVEKMIATNMFWFVTLAAVLQLVLSTPLAEAQITRSAGVCVRDHAAVASPDTCCFV